MPSKTDYVSASIIEDSDNDNNNDIDLEKVPKIKKTRQVQKPLQKFYKEDTNIFEIGVDEVGRGPLFGRVYTAAVVLPKDDSFDHSRVKDSKKFNSKKKIEEAADYVKKNAIAWYVSFEDEKVVDEINILQATQRSMHSSILETRKQIIGKMKGNQGVLEKFLNLKSDEQFYNLFYSNISARVDYINSLVDVVHPALEDMCKGFVETTDTILPVPLYELLNSKLAMEFQRIKDRRDMLVDEKMAELKSDKLLELQITDAEPGLYDRVSETRSQVTSGISNFFSWQNQVSKTETENVSKQPLSTQELQDIYTNVDNSVK